VLEVARVTEAVMGNDLYFSHYFVQRFKDEVDPVDSRLSSYCLCFVIKVTGYSEDGGVMFFRSIGTHLPDYTVVTQKQHYGVCLSTYASHFYLGRTDSGLGGYTGSCHVLHSIP
jgi:hypothetical protein